MLKRFECLYTAHMRTHRDMSRQLAGRTETTETNENPPFPLTANHASALLLCDCSSQNLLDRGLKTGFSMVFL